MSNSFVAKDYLSCLREDICSSKAYQTQQTDCAVKLDAMESPYSMQATLRKQWQEQIIRCEINRYPEAEPTILKQKLMAYADVADNCNILLGNGSDELIQIIMLALTKADNYVLSPEPSFSVYPWIANIVSLKYVAVMLNMKDFTLDRELMLTKIETYQPALICLTQPNNPTGNLWDEELIVEIVKKAPGYVLIDEAYAPFTSKNYMHLLMDNPNVLILRTMSKIGFAGLRFGFLAGHSDVIHELNKIRLPYNTGILVQQSIIFVLDHMKYFEQQIHNILRLRELLSIQLSSIKGIEIFDSEANFILFRIIDESITGDARTIFEQLKSNNILIKDLSKCSGLKNCLRVTVGSEEENRLFVDTFKKIICR